VQNENLFLPAALFRFFAESPEVPPSATPARSQYRERVMNIRLELLAATTNTLNGVLTHGASTEVLYEHVPEQLLVKIRADGLFLSVFSDEQTRQEDREGRCFAFESRVSGPWYTELLIRETVQCSRVEVTESWHFPYPPLPRVSRAREF
jgi:hypothetical protein